MTVMITPSAAAPRLTSLSHGGGCGCKIAPGMLADLLKGSAPAAAPFAQLLVGLESADDAAVYQLSEHQALVATTDFFMPIVDDPFDFGRIAAANALSDVYAMGGTPILALALLAGVHAMTDVTGFGLLGHLLEMCRGARLGARVSMAQVPLLENALSTAEAGCVTGASARNWASYAHEVRLAPQLEGAHQALLCDPQTSGGLLIACAPDAVADVTRILRRHGCARAAAIGTITGDVPLVRVEP